MRKISLKNLNLKEIEQLSREQLKNVLGGYSGSTGTDETTTGEGGGSSNNGGCKIAGGIHGGGTGTTLIGVCESHAPWDPSYSGEFCVLRQGNNVVAYNFGCIPA